MISACMLHVCPFGGKGKEEGLKVTELVSYALNVSRKYLLEFDLRTINLLME